MADIFLSYAREDLPRAKQLAEALAHAGWSVFWDTDIPTGKTWRTFVGKELREAQCVVVAWSTSSIESHFVHEEAEHARQREALVPVFLEKVDPPFGFGSFQTADLVDWDGEPNSAAFKRLVTDLAPLLGPPPKVELDRLAAETVAEAKRDQEAETARDAQRAQPEGTPSKLTSLASSKEDWVRRMSPAWLRPVAIAGVSVLVIVIGWQFWPTAPASQPLIEEGAIPDSSQEAPEPQIETFSASRTEITEGDRVTLEWNTSDADRVEFDGELVGEDGSTVVLPRETTDYELVATGPGGSARRQVRVSVAPPVPAPTASSSADSSEVELGAPTRTPPPEADDPLNRPIWIEGGTFQMGSDDGRPNEQPVHQVTLSGFWIQKHEVTNEEYARFVPSHRFQSGRGRYPVVNVNWREAMDYAVSLGGSLPTEAQWEFAARGTEGRTHPWGEATPTCLLTQMFGCDGDAIAVMSRPSGATLDGVHDLAGNVLEWVRDWYGTYGSAPQIDPEGAASGQSRVLRGGSFRLDWEDGSGAASRWTSPPTDDLDSYGLRVVWPGGRD